jgi:4-amino-4-deoxy-L-arabinose transferase-like glycosyltransferase
MWRLQLKQFLQDQRNRRLFALSIAAIVLLPLLALSFSRTFFTYATETDFLQTFVPEARRILAGEGLEVSYHLPGFPLVLAGVLSVIPDLLTAGLVIAFLSSVAALWMNFRAYKILLGEDYAWASVLTLWLSIPFMILSASATSDVYFYMLFCGSLWLAVLVANDPKSLRNASLLGLVIGIAFLTRSNGLTLFAAVLAPFITVQSRKDLVARSRIRAAGMIVGGSLVPILIWLFVSVRYGMPFSPSGTVDNLAMTYFSTGDGIGLESMEMVRGKFDSVLDVFLHDPAAVLSQYFKDLFDLPLRALKTVAFPFSLIAIPGFVLLMLKHKQNRIFWTVLLLLFLPQILLVNLKTYEPRYYLFLAPLIVLSMYEAIKWGWSAVKAERLKRLYLIGVITAACFASFGTVRYAAVYVHAQNKELGSLIAQTQSMDLSGHVLASRKIQTAYYTGADHALLIGVSDLEDLRLELADIQVRTGKDVVFYYGGMEDWKWPGLLTRDLDAPTPSWLRVLACSDDPAHSWCLYRFNP